MLLLQPQNFLSYNRYYLSVLINASFSFYPFIPPPPPLACGIVVDGLTTFYEWKHYIPDTSVKSYPVLCRDKRYTFPFPFSSYSAILMSTSYLWWLWTGRKASSESGIGLLTELNSSVSMRQQAIYGRGNILLFYSVQTSSEACTAS
jgi:hypothetical protein